MRLLFTALLLQLVLFRCTSPQQSAESPTQTDSTQSSQPETYKVIRVDDRSSFKNLDILIDSTKTTTPDILVAAKMAKGVECNGTPCNVLSFWTSEHALKLWENKSNDPAWRRKNWVYLCEHNPAEYNVTVGELVLYGFYDDEYRKWGGKKKRPKLSSIDIQ